MKKLLLMILLLLAGCTERAALLPENPESMRVQNGESRNGWVIEENELIHRTAAVLNDAKKLEGPVTAIGETFKLYVYSDEGDEQAYPVWLDDQSVMFEHNGKRYRTEDPEAVETIRQIYPLHDQPNAQSLEAFQGFLVEKTNEDGMAKALIVSGISKEQARTLNYRKVTETIEITDAIWFTSENMEFEKREKGEFMTVWWDAEKPHSEPGILTLEAVKVLNGEEFGGSNE
ncbi:DUF3221 domain-containing protein [Domibacillus enclensis]|uniref:Group 4 capsule polysaccharide lipoprotein gfcB, YjbF n=1 Tax=Domibacillus enclensis TaxID=1017273 RepID=A0A1N6Y177_9BACI|nr:DUF3221 domain-containing protein [Domibacillus enclensis]OXS77479.1 hypothetical protein B1B05_11625 [Domibacillus enclensis]SIR08219.1 hypothetical protein SAMN05443094_105114 [Domibacillus enclensis]